MRIAHVTSYQIPGFGYEEIYLARAQQALGHEVTIVTSNYLYPNGIYAVLSQRFPQRQIAPCEEESEGVRVTRLASHEIAGRVWLSGLEARIESIRPDVVHCHNVLQFHTARLALMKAVSRRPFTLVVDEHMQTSVMRKSMGGKLFYRTYGMLAQPVIGHYVAHYSAKNDDAKRYMENACRIRAPIEVMALGVDTDRFIASETQRQVWRSAVGIPQDALLFVYTGKLIRAKGPHLLAEAAIKVLQDGMATHVAFVGDAEAEYVTSMHQSVTRAGLGEYFHFLPSVPHSELPAVYASGDVGVWPRQESMAMFEALSAGLPVIVNSSSGYAPVVESGVGLVFDPDSASSLAQSMVAISDLRLRKQMGAMGRALAIRSYSWKQCAERYVDAYQRTLDASAGS